MRRANPRQIGTVCQFCAFVPTHAARQSFVTRTTLSQVCRALRSQGARPLNSRWQSTTSAAIDQGTESSAGPLANASRQRSDPAQLAKVVEETRTKFLSTDGIPTKDLTTAALQTCLKAAEALQPLIKRAEIPTSRLVALGSERTGIKPGMDAQLKESINKISYSAYTIINHPNVEMTPEFLELYVVIQATLGRPESLPTVLSLFASKPKPVVKNGEIQYIAQNPNKAVKAVEEDVANMALQTAIDARNLDSALGIVEASFALPAFKRQKLLKHSTAPALALGTLPFGIFGLASGYAAYWQNTMDIVTATGIGCAGISGYFFVVGSLGLIAKLSHKDHMKRVTWAPGTPLRYRWLREEERRALDQIALAWGFKEPWRHGEESGPEWEGLKEYMGYRQMILDRVEFMEGMG